MSRDLCDEIKSISTVFLKNHGYINGGGKNGMMEWRNTFGKCSSVGVSSHISEGLCWIRLTYTQTDWDGKNYDYDYQIVLTTTKCRLGGKRYWFICPLLKNDQPCNRRVGRLYIGGKYFGCRHCYQLGYRSQYKKISGPFAADFEIIWLADDIDKKREEMRVKFWKGHPTKRYAKLLAETEMLRVMGRARLLDRPVHKN